MAASNLISTLQYTQFADTTARMFYGGRDLPQVQDLSELMSLYMVEYVPKGTGSQKVYDEIDGETYARYKGEGVDASKTLTIAGYSKTMTKRRFAAEIDITFEARNEGKEQEVIRKLTSLATFCPQRMALDMTHFAFTFATATAYTDMDGESVDVTTGDSVAQTSASHTLTGTSDGYSTVISGNPVFSQTAFETALELSHNQVLSNFGEIRLPQSQPVVVTGNHSGTVAEVKRLLNSMADVDGVQSGIKNVYSNMFKHVILPRMATTATGAYDSTKIRYWFLLFPDISELRMGIWEEPNLKMPASGNNGEDIHNDNWTFGARCGFGLCIPAAKGKFHSTGLGS